MSPPTQPEVPDPDGPPPQAPAGTGGRTLWHGRFGAGPAEDLMAYTASVSFDRRLGPDDVEGSRAHVRGLGRVGLLTGVEVEQLIDALDAVGAELAEARFELAPSDEDIHTAVERRVTELTGPVGGKLHTGRSRNDQVATDLRLFCRRELRRTAGQILGLQEVLLARAEAAGDARVPGYTHLQRAQPVTLAHHLLAHGWALARDVDRLVDAVDRLDVSPLGAGALAGTSLPLDPDATAADLGFGSRFENSLDAVSDRDFVAEALFCLSMIAVHLSRLGEEIVTWSSEEFGFVVLDDAHATGSSMMPQKKNPDIAELARGKTGRVIGALTGLLVVLKGLPLAYNRDLQEDKEPLFDALDQVGLGLVAMTGLLSSCELRTDQMAAAADDPLAAATDLAELLVLNGTPFREAHAVVGSLVRRALTGEAPFAELVAADGRFAERGASLLAPGASVANRRSPGSGGPDAVQVQRARFRRRLDDDRARLEPGPSPAGG